jgi:putative ATP-binding cassette transporter
MSLLYFLLRHSRVLLIAAVFTGLVGGAGSAGLIALINTGLNRPQLLAPYLIWIYVVVGLLVVAASITSQVLLIRLAQSGIFELRMHLCGRVLGAPLRRLEEIGAARLLAALTDDVLVITNAQLIIPTICINAAVVFGCLVYLCWLSWVVLLTVLGFITVGGVTFQIMARFALRSIKRAREEQDTLFKHFRALTQGATELKLHRRRRVAFLSQMLRTSATNLRRQNVVGMTIFAVAGNWALLLIFALIGLILSVVPNLTTINTPVLTGYTLTILYMAGPLGILLSSVPLLSRANVALKKVEALGITLAEQSTEEDSPEPSKTKPAFKRLELEKVTHLYQREKVDGTFTLGPISLSFQPGELVFLTGGNGSGKTTLAKVITGLYAPETGMVRVDGRPITNKTRDHYRQMFSAVFSDFFLFEQLLGLEAPGLDERAHEYLARLQLTHKVEVQDGKLSTTELSHGQRKRLALLTAYLEDRPFYVFDEWAADQDYLFKDIFYCQLLPELKAKGKTVLVISHDNRYYHVADRIIKLDYGQLEEDQRNPAVQAAKVADSESIHLETDEKRLEAL